MSLKATDLWPGKRGLSENLVHINLGDLSAYDFGETENTSGWVARDNLDSQVTYLGGATKRTLTEQQVSEMGATPFYIIMHIFVL